MWRMGSKQSITNRSSFRKPPSRALILGFLFVADLCLRLYGIGQPPMEFNAVRQYHGALLARGLYEWLLTGHMETVPLDGILEPPILEFAASFSYLALGGEHLWVPRLLSLLSWMVGGILLYLIAKRLVSQNAATFSVFFYLFDPATVTPSRAFMPDSLMIMLVGWGNQPFFSEFSKDGELLFNAGFPPKDNSYRAFRFLWSGHPSNRPAAVAERASEHEVKVYASWNGATEVVTWKVLAGPRPGQLESVGSVPREGFETAMLMHTAEPYVAVQAKDRSGRVLGTSKVLKVRS